MNLKLPQQPIKDYVIKYQTTLKEDRVEEHQRFSSFHRRKCYACASVYTRTPAGLPAHLRNAVCRGCTGTRERTTSLLLTVGDNPRVLLTTRCDSCLQSGATRHSLDVVFLRVYKPRSKLSFRSLLRPRGLWTLDPE